MQKTQPFLKMVLLEVVDLQQTPVLYECLRSKDPDFQIYLLVLVLAQCLTCEDILVVLWDKIELKIL